MDLGAGSTGMPALAGVQGEIDELVDDVLYQLHAGNDASASA